MTEAFFQPLCSLLSLQTLKNPVTIGEQMDADAPSKAAPSPAAVTVPAAPVVYQAGLFAAIGTLWGDSWRETTY